MSTSQSIKQRLISVDALRGLAALIVVFYHAREEIWVGTSIVWHTYHTSPNLNAWLSYLTFPFLFGEAAVPLFFVISGYCIHRPHALRLKENKKYRLKIRDYLVKRLWRIYPVLIVSLIFTAGVDALIARHNPHSVYGYDDSFHCFVVNVFSFQNIQSPTYGTNSPLWTIGVEIHFYLLYPLLLWFTTRIGSIRAGWIVLGVSLASLVVLRLLHSHMIIFAPFWFIWFVGFLVAECEAGQCSFDLRRLKILMPVFLTFACVLYVRNDKELSNTFFALLFGYLLLWSIGEGGERFWSKYGKVFAQVGVISYSLYAFHFPFIVFFRSYFLHGAASPWIIVPVLCSLLCVALAFVMFWCVERWSLKVPKRLLAKQPT